MKNMEEKVVAIGKFHSIAVLKKKHLAHEAMIGEIKKDLKELNKENLYLKKLLESNDGILKKFFELDEFIYSSSSIIDIFDGFFEKIKELFHINNVWLTIVEDCSYSSDLKKPALFEHLYTRICVLEREELLYLLGNRMEPIIANENLDLYRKASPVSIAQFIKSIVMIPLIIDDEIIGSLNFGYHKEYRFHPDLDPIFLKMLGLKISFTIKVFLRREEQKQVIHLQSKKS